MVKFSPRTFLWIAVGSVVGATLRSWLAIVATGVFVPNVLGSLVLGAGTVLLTTATEQQRPVDHLIGLTTGFCGSLTSFSTVMLGIAQRLPGDHQEVADTAGLGDSLVGLGAMVACGLAAIILGRRLGHALATPT